MRRSPPGLRSSTCDCQPNVRGACLVEPLRARLFEELVRLAVPTE